MADSRFKTMRHIETVRNYLNRCIVELLHRAEQHDRTKLESPEVEMFDEWTDRLRGSTYNSPEYLEFRRQLDPILQHHYAENRHHPEFYRKDEEWRPVRGFEDHYKVSSYGNVRSISRFINRSGSLGDLFASNPA